VPGRLDLVALSMLWTEGPGRTTRRRSATPDREGADGAAPDPWTLLDLDEVLKRLAVPDPRDAAADLRRRAGTAIADADARGLGLVLRGNADYPDRLAFIPDPPPVLWTRGTLDSCALAVAIVGSRTATPQGLEVAFRLGEGLARAGLLVVSGLARGVDAAAHRGALRGGGRTIAVLGCGVDVAYPPEHARLALEIAASGAVVSEFAPRIPPRGWHFPRRNRIISGVSMGVVIVEASDRSGSLITARCALEQGRSVMAVPGGVLSGRNRGAHALLRDGARVVEDARDVIEELELDWCQRRGPEVGSDPTSGSGAREVESDPTSVCPVGPLQQEPILRAMKVGEPCGLEELSEQMGLDPVELLARLARLELSGWILRVEGGQFVKAGGNVLR
jgi:DNA processing protein